MNARIRWRAGLALAGVALVAGGCGGSRSSHPPDYTEALRDAPASLAKLYSQANQLLPGGEEAFERDLKSLRGYPVVVNIWASWCGGCLADFPMFQQLSAQFGTRVAFVGVDSFDDHDAAATQLREAPLPYPSYTDSSHDLARLFGTTGLPATAFLDRTGDLIFLRRGNYRSEKELSAEIKRYALSS